MTKRETVQDIRRDFLLRLSSVKERGSGWKASCPVPGHGQGRGDRNPSLSIDEGQDRLLVWCHAGCSVEQIAESVGLKVSDFFVRNDKVVNLDMARHKRREKATDEGISLETYAAFTGLPEEFLRSLGIREATRKKRACLLIDYHGESGKPVAERRRFALEKTSEGVDVRFEWKTGDKALLYGLQWLKEIRESGQYVILVEGESDTQVLRYHGINALGIPGADTFKEEWTQALEGIEKIYLVVEPDGAGSKLAEKLGETFGERLHLMTLGEHKDVRDLHLASPDAETFKKRLREAFLAAIPYREFEQLRREEAAAGLWEKCKDLAESEDILKLFIEDLEKSGVAGERKVAKILYLAATTRYLDKPTSVAVKGPSAGGKSYLTKKVLEFTLPKGTTRYRR